MPLRTLLIASLAMLLGALAGAFVPSVVAGSWAEGADVPCVHASGKAICKGQSIGDMGASRWHREFGGIVAVLCDYHHPGQAKQDGYLLTVSEIAAGCKAQRYVVSVSDGAVQTNFWIDGGSITQIDRYDANPVEL